MGVQFFTIRQLTAIHPAESFNSRENMVFKVLCFTLVACTLVQATLPSGGNLNEFFNRTGYAFRETIDETAESIKEKKQASSDFRNAAADNGLDVMEVVVKGITTFPRIALKMMDKNGSNNGKFSENLKDSIHETIDENAASKKKAADSMSDSLQNGIIAAEQGVATIYNFAKMPSRFFSKIFAKGEDNV